MEFTGLYAATLTPMHSDGELNLSAIYPYVEYLVKSKVDGVFVCGSTGEWASLTLDERRVVAERFVQAVAGRLNVIVHVGANCLADPPALAAHAAKLGVSAISACPPGYFRPRNVDVVIDCVEQIATAAPELPIFYYHIPAMTGVHISLAEFFRKAAGRLPSLAGAKYTLEQLDEYIECLNVCDARYTIMFGRDEMLLSALAAGAVAAVGTTYNFTPRLYQKLWRAWDAGDLDTARLCQLRSVQYINLLRQYGGSRAGKSFMKLIGIDCGPPRLPLDSLSDDEEASLRQELTEIGFFDWFDWL
ncbi:MAG: dihydrodipicolinate synthase family protein [Planctomycetes bacterium]|nr:dihydrodipicolinate synthase family protein [Planctomycetota bacterium]